MNNRIGNGVAASAALWFAATAWSAAAQTESWWKTREKASLGAMCEMARDAEAPRTEEASASWRAKGAKALGAAEDVLDGVDNEPLGMFGGIAPEVAGWTIPETYVGIVKNLDKTAAKGNGVARYVWMPRKVSTWLGSIGRVAKGWEAVEKGVLAAQTASIAIRGALENKSAAEVVDDLVESRILASSPWGELGYWEQVIAVGLSQNRSIGDAVADAFDPKTAGVWSKAGWGLGYWATTGYEKLLRWMSADDRAKVEASMLANLRAAGYGAEAEEALRAWLALDLDERALHPFVFKEEWLLKADGATEDDRKVCEEKPKRVRKKKGSGKPCMSCLFGDLSGVCSTRSCPNYGHPHSEFKW